MAMTKAKIINHRQKTLLGLLNAFHGRLSALDLQKYLFLYTQEFEKEPSFDFVPYKYGCFSFQSYADKRRLVDIGALDESDDWRLRKDFTINGVIDDTNFTRFYARYSALKGDRLVQHVYRRYPYYAINSEIASRLMSDQEAAAITAKRPHDSSTVLFTIGYEGSSFEGYLNRLIRNDVRTLVDVRRNPLSRKYGFSKKTLGDTVKKLGMEYIHIPELGITSDKRQNLETQADYERLFAYYEKSELAKNNASLKQILALLAERGRVALTCFEAQVCMCHRGRVAKALSVMEGWKYRISHI
jgi:uncharacterized protein (DUF488 family)